MARRRAAACLAALAGSGLTVGLPRAQCAMCGLAAEQAGSPESVAWTFGAAVLVLLVPLLGMVSGVAFLVWRSRLWDGAWQPDRDQIR